MRLGLFRNVVLLAMGPAIFGRSLTAADPPRPNIVLIVADDLGYGELASYGGQIPTPNLDALAASGVRLTDGYVSCPVCSPTRAGLITGRYQQRFGHEFNPGPALEASEQFGLPLEEKTLADRLQAAGYATGMVGKWHLGYRPPFHPLERGFQEFYGFLGGAHSYLPGQRDQGNPIMRGRDAVEAPEYLTDQFAVEAVSFIDRHREKPFFLYLPFNAVHAPLQTIAKYEERFATIEDPKRRRFAAMLSAMDDAIGAVVATLRDSNLSENTLVFFIGDNGGPTPSTTSRNGNLRNFKGTVYEGGIRVPFIISWPGHLPAGEVYQQPTIALDIVPTALAAAGASISGDDKLDGVDLLPYLMGEAQGTPHDRLYWRFGEQSALREGNMKLVQTPDGVQLFDLANDVAEQHDLAGDQPEVVKAMQAAWGDWNKELSEPKWKRGRPGQRNRNRQRNRQRARGEAAQDAGL